MYYNYTLLLSWDNGLKLLDIRKFFKEDTHDKTPTTSDRYFRRDV